MPTKNHDKCAASQPEEWTISCKATLYPLTTQKNAAMDPTVYDATADQAHSTPTKSKSIIFDGLNAMKAR